MRAFRVAYDGAPYHGFQRQPSVPTVEDAIFDALVALAVHDTDDHRPAGYAAAGRTDAGVSALAQTVAFEAPEWLTPLALNGELPRPIRAWAHADAPEGFHATHDALTRTYRYHLHAPDPDLGLVTDAAARFEGTHDVHNLTTDREGTVREIQSVTVEREGEFLDITIRAPGFCRHQVRRMVTVLYHVATQAYTPSYVDHVLGEVELTGPAGIPSAPAYALVLVDVAYPDLDWTVDEEAASNARDVFSARRDKHRAQARGADSIAEGVDLDDG